MTPPLPSCKLLEQQNRPFQPGAVQPLLATHILLHRIPYGTDLGQPPMDADRFDCLRSSVALTCRALSLKRENDSSLCLQRRRAFLLYDQKRTYFVT